MTRSSSPVQSIASSLAGALIALDFDGTLAPIVNDPQASRPVSGVVETLAELAAAGAQVAVVTGRDANTVLRLGELDRIGNLIVSGLHGAETWRAGRLTTLDTPAGLAELHDELATLLPAGVWIEDKRLSLVVHTRQASDPQAALAEIDEPVRRLVAARGLDTHPGKLVLEIRLPELSKASALDQLLGPRTSAALFAGDDLGDLPAMSAIRAWAERTGRPAVTIAVGEVVELQAVADLQLADPAALAELLGGLLAG